MKMILLILPLFFTWTLGFAQAQVSGKIINAVDDAPIAGATISSTDLSTYAVSDDSGNFQIALSDTLTIRHLSYSDLTFVYSKSTSANIIIRLQPLYNLLGEISVLSTHREQSIAETHQPVYLLSKKEIDRVGPLDFSQVLNQVPGIFMHSGAYNTNRITIRGIGSRNLFGTAKIKSYFGNIPLTNGSGESTIEDIDLLSVGRAEVIRGPSGSKYGAGLGGAILLKPNLISNNSLSISSGIGSYGYFNGAAAYNFSKNKIRASLLASNHREAGYRMNNNFSRSNLNLHIQYAANEKNNFSLLHQTLRLIAEIPSSLNIDDYENAPTKAAFTWGKANGKEDYLRSLSGINWNHQYKKMEHDVAIFMHSRNAQEDRPFNILEDKNVGYGIRARLNSGKNKYAWTVGTEWYVDNYDWKTFENLYASLDTSTSIRGEQIAEYKELRLVTNSFFDGSYALSKKLSISAGLNFNTTYYDLRQLKAPVSVDQSGSYFFGGLLSPNLGMNWNFSEHSNLIASVSHGFSPPTLEETLLPDGAINANISPETGWNYELGLRQAFPKIRSRFAANIYYLQLQNLLVARRTAQDEFIGLNAGASRNIGLEIDFQSRLVQKENYSCSLSGLFNIQQFTFLDFIDDEENHSGNFLPGLPQYRHRLSLQQSFPWKISLTLIHQHIGEMFLRDDNILKQDAYQILDLVLAQKINLNRWSINWQVNVQNLLNEKYASMLLINAGSFGSALPRYYYPGRPTNILGKVIVTRNF